MVSIGNKPILIFAILAIAIGLVWFFAAKKSDDVEDPQEMTLEQAAKVGEKTTLQLLVQIQKPKGKAEDLSGRPERGDVVLSAPADKEFSLAEKEGFLIIKMELTPKQAEILTLSLEKKADRKDEDGRLISEAVKRRKFAVDLSKLGIADDDEKGRVIEDRIFRDDVFYQKNIE